jgi:ribosomal protein L32
MATCPKCNEKGIIHYPHKVCTRCALKIVNDIEDKRWDKDGNRK